MAIETTRLPRNADGKPDGAVIQDEFIKKVRMSLRARYTVALDAFEDEQMHGGIDGVIGLGEDYAVIGEITHSAYSSDFDSLNMTGVLALDNTSTMNQALEKMGATQGTYFVFVDSSMHWDGLRGTPKETISRSRENPVEISTYETENGERISLIVLPVALVNETFVPN